MPHPDKENTILSALGDDTPREDAPQDRPANYPHSPRATPPRRRSSSFLDGLGASLSRAAEFGADADDGPQGSGVYRHLYERMGSDLLPHARGAVESPPSVPFSDMFSGAASPDGSASRLCRVTSGTLPVPVPQTGRKATGVDAILGTSLSDDLPIAVGPSSIGNIIADAAAGLDAASADDSTTRRRRASHHSGAETRPAAVQSAPLARSITALNNRFYRAVLEGSTSVSASEVTSGTSGSSDSGSDGRRLVVGAPSAQVQEQAQLLLVSLLDNFCALYDRDPQRNRRLFLAVCRRLHGMGILSKADFFTGSEALRGVYRSAFRSLVSDAIESLERDERALADPSVLFVPDGPRRLIRGRSRSKIYVEESSETGSESSASASSEEGSALFSLDTESSAGSDVPEFAAIALQHSRLRSEFTDILPIGRGGFAHVVRGTHRLDRRQYAFKRIHFRSTDSAHYAKIIREIKSLASLEHPNIVRYHGAWIESVAAGLPSAGPRLGTSLEGDGRAAPCRKASVPGLEAQECARRRSEHAGGYYMYIQMELCQLTLADWLEQRNFLIAHGRPWTPADSARPLPPDVAAARMRVPPEQLATRIELPQVVARTSSSSGGASSPEVFETRSAPRAVWAPNAGENWRIFRSIVRALQHIHRSGVIHRDLKPGNIFFQASGGTLVPKIGDFGLASVDALELAHAADRPPGGVASSLGALPIPIPACGSGRALSASLAGTPSRADEDADGPVRPGRTPPFGSVPGSASGSLRPGAALHTTGLGTCMYAAPEQINRPGRHSRDSSASGSWEREAYDEKVDIYSLGIILFEMFQPFATRMERSAVLGALKDTGVFPPDFVQRWPKEAAFIWSCVSRDASLRPSAAEILASQLFEQDPEATIERLSNENTALKRMLDHEQARARSLLDSLTRMTLSG